MRTMQKSGWMCRSKSAIESPSCTHYFLQEQKQKDIAVMLGIGLPLVKYRIRRARELLAGYLGDGG